MRACTRRIVDMLDWSNGETSMAALQFTNKTHVISPLVNNKDELVRSVAGNRLHN
jgi:hypothetical protein